MSSSTSRLGGVSPGKTASSGVIARRHHYNYEMGMGHGDPDFQDNGLKLPGLVMDTTQARAGEQNQRAFYGRWSALIAGMDREGT